MRVLLIHNESRYFGGCEKMLHYFVPVLQEAGCEIAVATVADSRVTGSLPIDIKRVAITDNGSFSLSKLWRQTRALARYHKEFPYDVVHGWAARDWELASVVGWATKRPVIGTLHDHPKAVYISSKRRRLMRWTVCLGLNKVVCVSNAVREACLAAGYPPANLTVVHNGIPLAPPPARRPNPSIIRIGYLGNFSEIKGLGVLFKILDKLEQLSSTNWELYLAGRAQDRGGEQFVEHIRSTYQSAKWWTRVHWSGWVDESVKFLSNLDLLIFPSIIFDSFPNVLLEAGMAGVPVLASNVGGAAEIVQDGETGWLFEADRYSEAARLLANLLLYTDRLREAGESSRQRVTSEFPIQKMGARYLNLYNAIACH